MIRGLTNNDVVECIQLMNKYSFHAHYERNEAVWITTLDSTYNWNKDKDNPHYIALGDFDDDGYLNGFLLGSTFTTYYNNKFCNGC